MNDSKDYELWRKQITGWLRGEEVEEVEELEAGGMRFVFTGAGTISLLFGGGIAQGYLTRKAKRRRPAAIHSL